MRLDGDALKREPRLSFGLEQSTAKRRRKGVCATKDGRKWDGVKGRAPRHVGQLQDFSTFDVPRERAPQTSNPCGRWSRFPHGFVLLRDAVDGPFFPHHDETLCLKPISTFFVPLFFAHET